MPAPLMALGPHIFEIFPLNLQKIEEELTINWPAIGQFGTRPARQFTGPGDETLKIEGLIFSEEFGGYPDYLALKATARAGIPVDVMSWGPSFGYGLAVGLMAITKVGGTHEFIGPDGIGRKITFSVELAAIGGSMTGGLF